MPRFEPPSVRLHRGGRHFNCPFCESVREHPPVDLSHLRAGYAYCDLCGRWLKIENYREFKTEEEFDETQKGEEADD